MLYFAPSTGGKGARIGRMALPAESPDTNVGKDPYLDNNQAMDREWTAALSPTKWFKSASDKREANVWIFAVSAILLAIPLLIWAYIGTLTRFSSDDYCWSMAISDLGFWGFQWRLYTGSFGRWASSLLLSGISYLGPTTAPILPATSILLWVGSLAWINHAISRRKTLSFILAAMLISAAFAAAPRGAIEPLYWQSALLTYLPPFFIGAAGAALTVRTNSAILAGGTGLIVCGFNEAISAMVFSGLILAIPCVRKEHRRLLCSALAGSLVSLGAMLASPGNAIRHNDSNPPDYIEILMDSLAVLSRLFVQIATSPTGILLIVLAIFLASFFGLNGRMRFIKCAWLSLAATIPAAAASLYGIKTLMARTAFAPTFAIVAALLFVGLAIGSFVKIRSAWLILICSALFCIATGIKAASLMPIMRDFNQAWTDQNELFVQSSLDSQITLRSAPNPFHDSWQVRLDPDWVINQCLAYFYGVQCVRLAQEPSNSPENPSP